MGGSAPTISPGAGPRRPAMCHRALRRATQTQVRASFEELRDEEAEHLRVVEEIIARLPPPARLDIEDDDDTSLRMGY